MSIFYPKEMGEHKLSGGGAGFVRFYARFSANARHGLGNVLAAGPLWALSAAVAALVTFGCGSPVANLEISAPSSVIVGSPFTVTVTVMADGRRDTVFNSPIHFVSSDSAAVIPADYTFTPADAGSHAFINGVTLLTVGGQNIKATDPNAPSITATAHVTVTAASTDSQ
jgi:hypothetical protein